VEEDQFGNRGLVVRGAVSGHVKRSLFAEFPCLLQASKTVSQQPYGLVREERETKAAKSRRMAF